MKRKAKIGKGIVLYIVLCLLSFAGILIFATGYITRNYSVLKSNNESDLNYQSVNSGKESNIIIWNSKLSDEQVIRVDANKESFEILEDVYYDNQIFIQYQYNKKNNVIYGVGKVNVSTGKVSLYDIEDLEKYKWNSLRIKDGKIYILMNDMTNRLLKEFKISLANDVVCEQSQEFSYPEGKVIVKSQYYNDKINICLNDGSSYYYENTEVVNYESIGKSPFGREFNYEIDEEAAKVLRKDILLDLLKRYSLIFILTAVVIGLFFSVLFGRKTFVSKMFVSTEILGIAIIFITIICTFNKTQNETIEFVKNNVTNSLKDVTVNINESGKIDYITLNEISDSSAVKLEEIMIIENTSDSTIVRGGLLTPENVVVNGDGYFGKNFSDLINGIDNEVEVKKIKKGNKDFTAIILQDTKDVNVERLVIGFVNNYSLKKHSIEVVKDILKSIILWAFICNLIVVVVYVVCLLRFRRFSNALLTLVKSHDRYERLNNKPIGLKKEWNALDEVKRILTSVSYEKVQRLDMYNKFIPKDFENLMERKSLLDVELGDVVDITGSVVTINMDENFVNGDAYLKTAGNVFKIINSAQNKENGVVITEDSRLIDTKLLFKDNVNDAIDFAIEVMHGFDNDIDIANKEKLIVVNYSDYKCGTTGCEERIIPYVYSNEENIIINYIESLRRAGVKIVLTESAVEKSNNKHDVRYIGYITENDKNIKIYECLDAYSKVKKELLLSSQKTFKKALGLFYSNDFYLARNTFNDVLKVNPDDRIARWYLFNCEHNLNNTSDNEISYGLFENKVYEQLYQIK
ncbi:MAG: hypothetical protein IJA34_13740 [Lachnospiraceae bacterium]|nr:hypothetical protein [Lachnospiraceae bacterium]